MARYLIVSMRSGEKHVVELDPNEETTTEACEVFYKGMDLARTSSLRLNNKIIIMKYVEVFTFTDREDENAI